MLAGPGSGKTHTLIEKLFHIFDQQIIPEPYGVLAVTFSNAAVTEINRRLWDKSFRHWDRVSVRTFHGFARYLLRCYGSDVGIREDFEVINHEDRRRMVDNLLANSGSSRRRFEFISQVDRSKSQSIYPECEDKFTMPFERRFLAAYTSYQRHLSEHNQLDFGDLIHFSIKLLEESKLANELFTRYFRYIIADEFQDTDRQQLRLIKLMTCSTIGSTVVADDDQAIYGFRGSDRGNVNAIKQLLGADLITLPENFRSPAIVVEAAQLLIRNEANRSEKQLVAMKTNQGTLCRAEFSDDQVEANAIARTIMELRNRREIDDLGQVAIVSRNRNRATKVEVALGTLGIPCFDKSKLSFVDSWDTTVALAILELSCNIDSVDCMYHLMATIENSGISHLMDDQEPMNIACDVRQKLKGCGVEDICLGNVWAILECCNFLKMLDHVSANTAENERLIKNVHDLASSLQNEAQHRNCTLLETLSIVSGHDAVQIVTSHGSKGREFDHVFFVGVEDDVIPPSWRNLSDEQMSEERRIFYVTITRTRKGLYITSAKRVNNFAQKRPSRFISEIPNEYFAAFPGQWANFS